MNADLAQLVALTCHGNAFLRGLPVSEFLWTNSTCRGCGAIGFSELAEPMKTVVTKTPDQWFENLRHREARGLRLSDDPRNEAGMIDRLFARVLGGGGVWALEAVLPSGRSEFWKPCWEKSDANAPDRKIEQVIYRRIREAETLCAQDGDLSSIRKNLLAALEEIHEFARQHDRGGFSDYFGRAIQALTVGSLPTGGYYKDLAPTGALSPVAATILDACQIAWVFGGMGTWNDLGFDGAVQRRYRRVSNALYAVLQTAIAAAANDSFRSSV